MWVTVIIIQRMLFLVVALINFNCINAMRKPKMSNPHSLKDLCAQAIFKEHTNLDLLNCNQDIKEYLIEKQSIVVNDLLHQHKFLSIALREAIKRKHNCAIVPLIKLGARVNPEELHHHTPLIDSIEVANSQACKQLLSMGADPNVAAGHYDWVRLTPLTCAVLGSAILRSISLLSSGIEIRVNEMCIINVLLDFGALVNKPNSCGATPLFWAFKRKHWKTIIRCLLKRGAHINITDNDGQTPLMLTMRLRKGKAARYLISRGALIDPIDKWGQNAFMYACACDASRKVIRKLLDMNHAQIKMQDKKGNTALHVAVEAHHIKVVKLLLLHGASIDVRNEDGENPLDVAKRKKYEKLIIILEKYATK